MAVRWSTSATFLGMPMVAIALGPDPASNEVRGHARGFIAIGDMATGVIALGGLSRGVIALGGLAVGFVAFGGLGIGLAAFAGLAIGGLAFGALRLVTLLSVVSQSEFTPSEALPSESTS